MTEETPTMSVPPPTQFMDRKSLRSCRLALAGKEKEAGKKTVGDAAGQGVAAARSERVASSGACWRGGVRGRVPLQGAGLQSLLQRKSAAS